MTDDNSPDFKTKFIGVVKESYINELSKLTGVADSWAIRRPIVGLSGGPDSTTLLMVLNEIASDLGIKLRPIHVNHKLRFEESDKDQEFCEKLCENIGLELEVKQLNDQLSENPSEEELRVARYEIFGDFAKEIDSSLILTGHTSCDQVETMLFRLFRGTAPNGLLGIPVLRELETDSNIWVFRPLLQVSKIDCLKYLAANETQARQDSSNVDTKYDRNYIRHQIVPNIEKRFEQWKKSLLRLQNVVSGDEDFLNSISDEALLDSTVSCSDDQLSLDLEKLSCQHSAILRRMIVKVLRRFDNEPSYDRVDQILKLIKERKENSAQSLSSCFEVRVKEANLVFQILDDDLLDERIAFLSGQSTEIRLPDRRNGRTSASNVILWMDKSVKISEWSQVEYEEGWSFPSVRALEAVVDFRLVNKPIYARMRKQGDLIQPFGMQEMVKLKKYLHTHKPDDFDEIPEFQRELRTVIVLATEDEILWVPGYGISEKLKVREKPSHVITWLDLSHGGSYLA